MISLFASSFIAFLIAKNGTEIANAYTKNLVQFLATSGLVTLAANDFIMSGRLIQWLRHLKHQNWSIISDSIDDCDKMGKKVSRRE